VRSFFSFLFVIFCASCFSQVQHDKLLNQIKTLSADEMKGRAFGANDKAQQYIVEEFKKTELQPAFKTGYKQPFTHKGKSGNNLVGIIPGKSTSTIVITAHFDHLGEKNGKIFNGADDNASGTAALFAIAEYFKNHENHHTLVIAAVDAEEIGSIGAEYLLDNFPLPQENIKLNINLDMIAHNDKNEIYACGTYFYPQLKQPLTKLESNVEIKFGHDSPEYEGADNWTFASDHRVFHRKKIPFVYFGVEDHQDYHQPSDTYSEINETFYVEVVDMLIKVLEKYDTHLEMK